MSNNIGDLGLVGCGGAGFPTSVKLAAQNVDHFIVNGAECEPLLHKDKEILRHHTEAFFAGLVRALDLTGAKQGHVAVKAKYAELVKYIDGKIPDRRIKMLALGDFYPAGDEYELVYEAAQRLMPHGGIPLQVGCVVSNVETLYNLGRDVPVTEKFLTVAGDVPHAITIKVPVGISMHEVLRRCGVAPDGDFSKYAVIDGGPMMGRIIDDLSTPVTKTTGGLIVLPKDHNLIRKMMRSKDANVRIARSACDQCTDCSELCPRALLGYPIRPHKAMRAIRFTHENDDAAYDPSGLFCCECGLCSLFACPEDLPPREIAIVAKRHHMAKGAKPSSVPGSPKVHPLRGARRVSVESLLKRLGLKRFDHKAPLTDMDWRPEQVVLPLKQHVGVPAVACVNVGQSVQPGQLVASVPAGKLGAPIHASIAGVVAAIANDTITIKRQ